MVEGFYFSDEDEQAVQQILSKYETEGWSVRGTRKEIAEEMGGNNQITDDELCILSDGLISLEKM